MKMNTGLLGIGAITAALMLSACGSDEVKEEKLACVFPDAQTAAVGVAEKSAAGHSFMKNMAQTDARVQLAQSMKVHVQNMVKQYAETTGAADSETVDKVNTSVTKQITDETLVGTKIYKTRTSPNGALYVLLGMDASVVAAATENALKTSMNNDRALWQQFKAQKGQDELAAAIANMKQ